MCFFIFIFIAYLLYQNWSFLFSDNWVEWQIEIQEVLISQVDFSKNGTFFKELCISIICNIQILEPTISIEKDPINLGLKRIIRHQRELRCNIASILGQLCWVIGFDSVLLKLVFFLSVEKANAARFLSLRVGWQNWTYILSDLIIDGCRLIVDKVLCACHDESILKSCGMLVCSQALWQTILYLS